MMYMTVYLIIVLGLAALASVLWIDRNLYKQYMKEENGRVQLAEIRRWEAIYMQRPTVYELWIAYMENGEQKERLIRSSSSFLKRYKREKYIRIVTVPGTDFLFAEEENWQEQNASAGTMIVLAFVFELTIITLADAFWAKTVGYCIVVLYFFVLLCMLWHILRRRMKPQACSGHKTRMKYLVNLPCDAVIEMLGQGTDSRFRLKKETENVKDKGYLFSMHGRGHEKVRYRVFVTPTQEGSAVWFYLLECGNPYVLNRCAKKLGRIMQERIGAVRAF